MQSLMKCMCICVICKEDLWLEGRTFWWGQLICMFSLHFKQTNVFHVCNCDHGNSEQTRILCCCMFYFKYLFSAELHRPRNVNCVCCFVCQCLSVICQCAALTLINLKCTPWRVRFPMQMTGMSIVSFLTVNYEVKGQIE